MYVDAKASSEPQLRGIEIEIKADIRFKAHERERTDSRNRYPTLTMRKWELDR